MVRDRKTYSSRMVTAPAFSIAPMLYSGQKIWSYLPKGYGSPKFAAYQSKPSLVSRNRRSASRCSAMDARQYRPRGMVSSPSG